MRIKSVKNCRKIAGKKVLLRADFNVPIKNGLVVDNYKIIKSLATIEYLLQNDCKIILISHLGRPKAGEKAPELSLIPVARELGKIIGKNIPLIEDFRSLQGGTKLNNMKGGDIVLLENIRFEKGEMTNDSKLAKELAKLGKIYINDAFAVSHREQASVSIIKKYLPSYAGLLLESEVFYLNKVIGNPQKPLLFLVGGAKIKTKIPLINKMLKSADKILIGGALANNFLAADGFEVGKSLIDSGAVEFAKNTNRKKVLLPIDVVVSSDSDGEEAEVKKVSEVGKGDYIFDIGPETIRLYAKHVKEASTIVWNGPMGFFEFEKFKTGSLSLAQVIASRSRGKAFGIVGGGETVEALKRIKMEEDVDWVSTGGGAMLSFLGGEKMPGLKGLAS